MSDKEIVLPMDDTTRERVVCETPYYVEAITEAKEGEKWVTIDNKFITRSEVDAAIALWAEEANDSESGRSEAR